MKKHLLLSRFESSNEFIYCKNTHQTVMFSNQASNFISIHVTSSLCPKIYPQNGSTDIGDIFFSADLIAIEFQTEGKKNRRKKKKKNQEGQEKSTKQLKTS